MGLLFLKFGGFVLGVSVVVVVVLVVVVVFVVLVFVVADAIVPDFGHSICVYMKTKRHREIYRYIERGRNKSVRESAKNDAKPNTTQTRTFMNAIQEEKRAGNVVNANENPRKKQQMEEQQIAKK